MANHFEIARRDDGRWMWRLRNQNGQTVANDAGQGFRDARDTRRAIVALLNSLVVDEDIDIRLLEPTEPPETPPSPPAEAQ